MKKSSGGVKLFSNPILQAVSHIKTLIETAIKQCGYDIETEIEVSEPKDKSHGDFSTNVALKAAGLLKMNPRTVASAIVEHIDTSDSLVNKVEVAGPGFINFYLSDSYFSGVVTSIISNGIDYGKSNIGEGKKVMVEFVSANPTGPMHMGNARGGVVGDTLATILSWSGYDVSREFYVNDAGNQVDVLSRSLSVRYIQYFKGEDAAEFPEDGYHGDDVRERAAECAKIYGDSLLSKPEDERRKILVEYTLKKNIEKMQKDLENYRIKYDRWFFESELHKSGYVEDTVKMLSDAGYVYEQDGALWFRTTQFGCEKDEVLKKSNGFYTYYAVDIAYHRNKFLERHFDKVIDVFGADHHGHTLRFKAGVAALGLQPDCLQFVLIQLVRLMRGGEIVRMSKRTGKTISLADLLHEIPVDAARFFFDFKLSDSAMDFDLDLAVKQSSDNPVFYVQYAHARICSILKNLSAEGITPKNTDEVNLSRLTAPEERDLIRLLAVFPEEIRCAAENLEPTKMTRFAVEISSAFHKFYNACYVRCKDEELMYARLSLCQAARQVINNALRIINIEAPEKM
ncbi:MAG: arginine--tRNA ligase [Bacillota bacterium]|nr:arginine--tRNA ligase [Bacillota bacterium]